MSGVQDDQTAIWLAAATAFTNFLFTLVGVWLVERVGRRKLTLGSILGENTNKHNTGILFFIFYIFLYNTALLTMMCISQVLL